MRTQTVTDTEYAAAIACIHKATIYEICLDGVPLYRGQTLKPLSFRLSCHIADASRSSTPFKRRLQEILEAGQRDDLSIHPLASYDTEDEAIEDGPDTLLNVQAGSPYPPRYTGHDWTKAELKRLGTEPDRDIAEAIGISPTHVRNVRVKLGIASKVRRSRHLTNEQVRQVLRHRLTGRPYRELAELLGLARSTVGRILRGESYQHVDRPAEELDAIQIARAVTLAVAGKTLEEIAYELYAEPSAIEGVLSAWVHRPQAA
jgi:transcriptional regulator with XRE-family HTH domain